MKMMRRVTSVASSDMSAHESTSYSLMSIENFLQNTKGARNVKVDEVFPNSQLFFEGFSWSSGEENVSLSASVKALNDLQSEDTCSKGQNAVG